MELANMVVIVTGGGSGIGAATALTCAREGAAVVLGDIDTRMARETAGRIEGSGGRGLAVETDVSAEEQVQALVEAAVARYGRLDGIVNNAARIVVRPVHETTAADWRAVMSVNADGTFYGCKHAIRQFLAQESPGAIVNVGSISAVVGLAGQAAYCASKGAVFQLTRQVAIDYAARGIRCNSVGPGSVDTQVLADYLAGQPDPAAAREQTVAAHPIGRVGTTGEIAEVICFLLSARASFVTGANVQVDGGYSAR